MSSKDTNRELRKEEYSEVSANLRHYNNLRFAILTVFLAFNTALLSLCLGPNTVGVLPIAAEIAGIVGTLVFWTFQERLFAYRAFSPES